MSKATDALLTGLKEIADQFAAQKSLDEIKSQIAEASETKAKLNDENVAKAKANKTLEDKYAKLIEDIKAKADEWNKKWEATARSNKEMADAIIAKAKQTADDLINEANKTLGNIAVKVGEGEKAIADKAKQIEEAVLHLASVQDAIAKIKAKF